MTSSATLLTGILFFAGLSQVSYAEPVSEPTEQVGVTEADADFLRSMHKINQAEITTGNLAVRRGKRASVKDYGRMLVKDHTETEAKIAAIAASDGVELNPLAPSVALQDLTAKLALTESQLVQVSRPSFDALFAEKMTAAHEDAISLVEKVQRSVAPTPEVAQLAQDLLPDLRRHRDIASVLIDLGIAH